MSEDISPRLLALIQQVTGKRAKTVIEHILKHGFITTEDLKNLYGYDHPPRAIRDVRENGIPLLTFTVISESTGRRIAAYKFDDPEKIRGGRIGGRKHFSKSFKAALIAKLDSRSTLTHEKLDPRYLQIDHRVPYEIAGDSANSEKLDAYMLLDASSQRAKSWSCEHCRNFIELRDISICQTCFWAFPEDYQHVAMSQERRIHLVWQGDEVNEYDELSRAADAQNVNLHDYLKWKLSQK